MEPGLESPLRGAWGLKVRLQLQSRAACSWLTTTAIQKLFTVLF